jgi:hypothetical protein
MNKEKTLLIRRFQHHDGYPLHHLVLEGRDSEIAENFLMPAAANLPLTNLSPSHIQHAYNA